MNLLRDNLNSIEGYKEIIEENKDFITNDFNDLKSYDINNDSDKQKICATYKSLIRYECDTIKTYYSMGNDVEFIKKYLINLNTIFTKKEVCINYSDLLFVVSVSIMLNVKSDYFKLLAEISKSYFKHNNEEDFLVDFLIKSKIYEWNLSNSFIIDKPYTKLKEIIEVSKDDKSKASKLLQNYINKIWYKELIEVETHKSKWNIHTGYWSWEAGAIAKILNLDDSSLKDQPYYPYDMVHFKEDI